MMTFENFSLFVCRFFFLLMRFFASCTVRLEVCLLIRGDIAAAAAATLGQVMIGFGTYTLWTETRVAV